MNALGGQPGLFDIAASRDDGQAALARARMQEMIAQLQAATVPPWRDEMSVILDDGAFQRAMRLVPDVEAQALWTEFDRQMERLYAIWAQRRAG